MSKRVTAPFTPAQVVALNKFQRLRNFHPFTCGGEGRTDPAIHGDGEGVLVATVRGWVCLYCDYTQDWAHDFMADPEAIEQIRLNDPHKRALRPEGQGRWETE